MGRLHTDFLTADTGFLMGVGTSINLAGNFYGFNYSATPQEADQIALQSDWLMVGQDIRQALEKSKEPVECQKSK